MMRVAILGIVAFYREQAALMRAWRARPIALVRRAILSYAVACLALAVTSALLPETRITGLGTLLVAGLLLALLNGAARLLFLWLLIPVPLVVAQGAAFVFQVAVLVALGNTLPGVHVTGLTAAVWGSILLTILNSVLAEVVAVSDDESYYGTQVRQLVARDRSNPRPPTPGLLIVQIDGLGLQVLENAVRSGRVPVLAGLLRDEEMVVRPWTAMLPSTTPASQAGILHGRNEDIPGFRWFDKVAGRLMVANHPADAEAMSVRLSDGTGLLADGGASIGNLFDGDASQSYLTMATVTDPVTATEDRRRLHGFFVSTVDYLHLLVLMVGEVAKELYQAERERSVDVRPRMKRGLAYAGERAVTNVALRNLSTALVIEELFAATPTIYVDYTGYDAIAHHCGPERPEAVDALEGIDRVIGTLRRALGHTRRHYDLVVLSDHGQNLAATFSQRFGQSLQDEIAALMGGSPSVLNASEPAEHRGESRRIVSEFGRGRGGGSLLARRIARSRPPHGPAIVPPVPGRPSREHPDEDPPDLVVCASGNLALVYFGGTAERLSMEEIDELYPGLIDGLARRPGVGVVLAHSQTAGPILSSPPGRRALTDRLGEGADQLAPYGPFAVASLARLDGFPNAGDLIVLGARDERTGEYTSFEELVGSHGGLGGWQIGPFIAFPATWQLDEEPVVGAPAVHRQLVRWRSSRQGESRPTDARPADG
jgi:uncharacterized membrane protein YvlD (DUF360 family)